MIANTATPQTGPLGSKYVHARKLLKELFDDECRPSIRWLRYNQDSLPHVRIGRLVYFDPEAVRAHLSAKRR
jgi:hypothetical protein